MLLGAKLILISEMPLKPHEFIPLVQRLPIEPVPYHSHICPSFRLLNFDTLIPVNAVK